ncbi:MAG: site-specific integrase, partial [Proteobacteria bacterium]|nr:site-specific integrase [Pseudomonadota bacterium]
MATVRKRKWTYKGSERTAWVADYFDQEGKRRQKTFSTKKVADAWLVNARHELSNGVHTPDSASITIAEAGRRWLDHREREGLERSTIKQGREHLELHIAPFIGGEKLSR